MPESIPAKDASQKTPPELMSAFPCHPMPGISIRCYVATAAMAGMLATPDNNQSRDDLVTCAVLNADALIAKLKATNPCHKKHGNS